MAITTQLIDDFLGSAYIFALALTGLLEFRVLREATGDRLTSLDIKTLKLVSEAQLQSAREVASFLDLGAAAAGRLVRGLVSGGLIARAGAGGFALTPAGRRLLRAYERARTRTLSKLFAQFSPGDVRRAIKLLDRLGSGLVTCCANPEEICRQCSVYFKERCLLQEVVVRNCRCRKADGGQTR